MVKKLISLFGKEIVGIHEAAYLLAIFAFMSQLLALVRDKLLTFYFGAGEFLDIYYASFRIPDLIFVSIASIVSASVLVPFFIEKTDKDPDGGKRFIDSIFSFFFLAIIVSSIIVFIFVPELVKILLPGFVGKESFGEVVSATRILILSPIFLGLSNFFSSITQMHRRFLVYALSPIAYNIGIIVGIIFFYPSFGLKGLVFGVILGAFLHMAIQIPFIVGKNLFPNLRFSIDWNSCKKVIYTSLPRTITLSSSQLSSFFLIALASLMSVGSISVFNIAYNLQSVPLSIVGVSYSSAIFPTLSRFFSQGENGSFFEKMVETARHIIFWSIPITVLFVVLRAQIVRTIYGAGEFDWSDTKLTAAVLAIFILSVVGQNLTLLFIRSYYAKGSTLKPLIISSISAVIIALVGYILTKSFYAYPVFAYFLEELFKVSGIDGTIVLVLPMAFSIGIFFSTILFWRAFEKEHPGFSKSVIVTLFQTFSASVIMGYATFLALRFFNLFFSLEKAWGVFLQGFFAGITGILVGVVVLLLLRNKEIKEVWNTLHHKFWKARVVIPDQDAL